MGFLNLTYIFFFNPLFQIILVWKKGGRKKMRLLDCRKYNVDSVKLCIYPKNGGVPSTALWPTSRFLGAFLVNLYLHWRINKIAFDPRLNTTNNHTHMSLRGKGSTNDTGMSKVDIVTMYII